MAYADRQLSWESQQSLYVDLDLFVVRERNNKIFHPIHEGEDVYSTCERVIVPKSEIQQGDKFTIHIKSTGPAAVQSCALVIAGPIDETSLTEASSEWTNLCQNGGTPSGSSCECPANANGLFCQHSVEKLSGPMKKYNIRSMAVKYFTFSLSEMKENFSIQVKTTADRPLYLGHAGPKNFGKANQFPYTFIDKYQSLTITGTKEQFPSAPNFYLMLSNLNPNEDEPEIGVLIDQSIPRSPDNKNPARRTLIIIGAVIGGVVAIGIIVAVVLMIRARYKGSHFLSV
jgi:hypothetical protein